MLLLRYKSDTTIPVEAECIRPDHINRMTVAQIAELPVQHGNAQAPLGDFFEVIGDAGDSHIRIEGDCSRVKWIGAGMTLGRIEIDGDIGMHLGSEMKGGQIRVKGNAGDWVGAEMLGGRIHVQGNAGHLVGAGYRGSRLGMRGGTIMIDGNVGNEIGSAMRRGLIAIGGKTGDFPGVSMIAGSIFLFGEPGIRVGAGMKRGSLVLFDSQPSLLPSFRFDCTYHPIFLTLYLQKLKSWGFTAAASKGAGTFHRYSGDLVALGKGEVLFQDKP